MPKSLAPWSTSPFDDEDYSAASWHSETLPHHAPARPSTAAKKSAKAVLPSEQPEEDLVSARNIVLRQRRANTTLSVLDRAWSKRWWAKKS